MIVYEDLPDILADLLTGYPDGDSFDFFFFKKMKVSLDQYARNSSDLEIRMMDCLKKLFAENRIAEFILNAAEDRPGNTRINSWVEKAKSVEQARKLLESTVVLDNDRVFIGRDDLKLRVDRNLRKRQSWVIQLKGADRRSGVSYCLWYFKHRARQVENLKVLEISIKTLYEDKLANIDPDDPGLQTNDPSKGLVDDIDIANALNDLLKLNLELPEDTFKSSTFRNRFIGVMLERKEERYLLFIDHFQKQIELLTEKAKSLIRGLTWATRNIDNLCIVTSFPDVLDSNEVSVLSVIQTNSFTENELRDFLRNLYEELPLHTGVPNDQDEDTFIQEGMDWIGRELGQHPNVEAIGNDAYDFFIEVSQPQ